MSVCVFEWFLPHFLFVVVKSRYVVALDDVLVLIF